MIRCIKCGIEKSEEEFPKNKRHSDGPEHECKICTKERKKQWELANKERIREENAEQIKEAKHQDYLKRKEYVNKKNKEYYENNKEAFLISCKKYRIEHVEWKKNYDKEYAEKNPEKVRSYKRKWSKEKQPAYQYKRRREDLNYALLANIRSRISSQLNGRKKANRTIEILGCSIKELRQHLEMQFKEGMNWQNYGMKGWTIDHIKPCASFDLSDPEQMKECWNYKNLQPLWAIENIKKGAKLNYNNC